MGCTKGEPSEEAAKVAGTAGAWKDAADAWEDCAHDAEDVCEKGEDLLRAASCTRERANLSDAEDQSELEAQMGWYLALAAKFLKECADQTLERGDVMRAVEKYHVCGVAARRAIQTAVARRNHPWEPRSNRPEDEKRLQPPDNEKLREISEKVKLSEDEATKLYKRLEEGREEKSLPR